MTVVSRKAFDLAIMIIVTKQNNVAVDIYMPITSEMILETAFTLYVRDGGKVLQVLWNSFQFKCIETLKKLNFGN